MRFFTDINEQIIKILLLNDLTEIKAFDSLVAQDVVCFHRYFLPQIGFCLWPSHQSKQKVIEISQF